LELFLFSVSRALELFVYGTCLPHWWCHVHGFDK